MARKMGWSQMTTEQKLEALRDDLNNALDLAEDLSRKRTEDRRALQALSAQMSELMRRLGIG